VSLDFFIDIILPAALWPHYRVRTRPERYGYSTNGCVNSCVNSPEDGPVGPKHVEIRRYMNKIEIATSVGFSFHIHRWKMSCHNMGMSVPCVIELCVPEWHRPRCSATAIHNPTMIQLCPRSVNKQNSKWPEILFC